MSDCFDHQADAWDDFCFNSDRYVEGDSVYGYNAPYKKGRRSKRNSFCYDPDYYHTKIQFLRIVKETDKSYYIELFKIQDADSSLYVWIPKKICKDICSNSMKVHSNTYNKILRDAVELCRNKLSSTQTLENRMTYNYCKMCERAVQSPLLFCCEECERRYWRQLNFYFMEDYNG